MAFRFAPSVMMMTRYVTVIVFAIIRVAGSCRASFLFVLLRIFTESAMYRFDPVCLIGLFGLFLHLGMPALRPVTFKLAVHLSEVRLYRQYF